MSFLKITLAVTSLTAAIACGSSSPTTPTPTSMSASIVSGGFTPNPINISVGSTVTWTNMDNAVHAIVADGGAFSSGAIASGGQYAHSFGSAGTFTYHDSANSGMTGTVNVSSSSMPSPY